MTKQQLKVKDHKLDMCRVMRKPTFWFLTWSDTNKAVQLQKMARGLNFLILKVEGLYYPCSENKGADQLRGFFIEKKRKIAGHFAANCMKISQFIRKL